MCLTSVADFLASAMQGVGLSWKEHLTSSLKAGVQVPSIPLNSLATLDMPLNLRCLLTCKMRRLDSVIWKVSFSSKFLQLSATSFVCVSVSSFIQRKQR